jgi:hypothetical protein
MLRVCSMGVNGSANCAVGVDGILLLEDRIETISESHAVDLIDR